MSPASTAVRATRLFAALGALAFAASLATGVLLDRRLAHEVSREPLSRGLVWPLAINVVLFTIFALHHSILARTGVKAWLMQHVAPALERSIYVWTASVLFAATCLIWQPAPALVYEVAGPWAWGLTAARLLGVWLTLEAAARIDPRELSGVRQAWTFGMTSVATTADAGESPLVARGGYGLVRHPIYLGWMLMVWGAPVMSAGRLTFAAVSTLYLLVAIPFEERSLGERFGAAYDAYRRGVRWRVVPGVY
jgi:protein-S-isoprenylcysteine O-methyltransferase Ste14